MFKLALENAEESEIKLPTSSGSSKKQESSRKTSTSALVTMPKSLCGSQQQWKILQEMGLPDHLTCLLRNLYVGEDLTVKTRHEPLTCSKLEKEYVKVVYSHLAYLTSIQSTSWEM